MAFESQGTHQRERPSITLDKKRLRNELQTDNPRSFLDRFAISHGKCSVYRSFRTNCRFVHRRASNLSLLPLRNLSLAIFWNRIRSRLKQPAVQFGSLFQSILSQNDTSDRSGNLFSHDLYHSISRILHRLGHLSASKSRKCGRS